MEPSLAVCAMPFEYPLYGRTPELVEHTLKLLKKTLPGVHIGLSLWL